MPRNYLVFGDIEGKLDVLRVQCTKCSRRGAYYLHRLIEKHGRKGNMMKWKELLNGDCPKRDAHSPIERCDLICPDPRSPARSARCRHNGHRNHSDAHRDRPFAIW
jgi:hypothetical protein